MAAMAGRSGFRLLALLALLALVAAASCQARIERSLTYPSPSTLLLIFGLGTPLQLERESIIVGAFTKMIYALPSNASELTEPGVQYARAAEGTSRWGLYKALGRLLELYGLGDGRACVLRAICEASGAPFEHTRGLSYQLLQLFFSPSSTPERYEEYGDREYRAAELLGRRTSATSAAAKHCRTLYPECRQSLLDIFSSIA